MNHFFEKINRLSYHTVLFIASLLIAVSVLPLWVYISRQQTQISPKAREELPIPTIAVKPTDGPIPTSPPTITRVYPWVGKTGDVIVIEGKNFGSYPKNRRLAIGDIVVGNTDISLWSDTQILALIPSNPHQGGSVSIRIDTYPIVESVPLVFYDERANLRLHKNGQTLSVSGNVPSILKAVLYTENGKPFGSAQGKREITVSTQPDKQTTLLTLSPNEIIQSLLLTDDTGAYIPYSLNPTEFGF